MVAEVSAEREPGHESRSLVVSALAALGIVYGDIGTSPLYAFRVAVEAAGQGGAVGADPLRILGVLSLIVWALLVIVALKYVLLVMRADNHGEGGILALLALVRPWSTAGQRQRGLLIAIGIFGATLLYGDGVITPAISVLSAIEGLELATPTVKPWVEPITIAILIGLFLVQARGAAVIGRWFGPVMLVWFATIALLGVVSIAQAPQVLQALDPSWALAFLTHDASTAFLVVGAVFLAVTGGEALYADMGHVGRGAIRITWFALVMPALVLNYAGQAAELLSQPGPVGNPFFRLAPEWFLLPLVLLSTAATVIASQALISGVFSLTRQAVAMGLWPRMAVVQTSAEGYGQIYLPVVNYALLILTVAVVLVFESSDDLAAAYGMAVSGTMLITTVLLAVAMRRCWHWPLALVVPVAGLFIIIDLMFFSGNLAKLPDGGWLPLVAGIAVFLLMGVWSRGREYLRQRLQKIARPVPAFLRWVGNGSVKRLPGLGVFLTNTATDVPPMMQHLVRLTGVLPTNVLIFSVVTEEVPRVSSRERLQVAALGEGLWRVTARYGFMQTPNLPVAVRRFAEAHLTEAIDPNAVVYYLSFEHVVASERNAAFGGLSEWLFSFMAANAADASDFYRIPDRQVIEVGIRVDI